jgi:hypothetical protein
VLERLSRADLASHLSELAFHFVAALPGGDPSKALAYAAAAGRHALNVFA